MQAEIVTIGDEILIGQIVDTNSAWMGKQLNKIGVEVYQISSIGDNKEHIYRALDSLHHDTKLVFITGGLGPTNDDITKNTLSKYFDTKLVFNEELYKDIEKLFQSIGREVTELNRMQAEVPEACYPIRNPKGTAPGMWFEKDGVSYISMPGVPYEMKSIMSDFVIPKIIAEFDTPFIIHRTVLTQGIPESYLAETLKEWEGSLPSEIKLAYLPSAGTVRLRLSARGIDEDFLNNLLNEQVALLQPLIGNAIFGYHDDKLEEVVGEMLKLQGKTLSTAESCTGGYIAHQLTSIPGSSAYFMGAVVSYDNAVKQNSLGVNNSDIIEYGAVSEEVVTQMAVGVREQMNTDYAIATSGIAGPDGGTKEKPVGTVWIAIATPEEVIAKKFSFGKSRERNIKKTALMALDMLRKELS